MDALIRLKGVASGLLLLIASALASGGDLSPPVGAPAGTMKSLDQAEPRRILNDVAGDAQYMARITEAGSYHLTGDLVATPGKNGIGVEADNVRIDLSGFRILGGGGGPTTGITFIEPVRGFVLRHGTISGWAYAMRGEAFGCLLDDLLMTNNPAGAIENYLHDSTIRNIRVRGLAEGGITGGTNTVIEDCVIDGSVSGIFVLSGSIVRCAAMNCGTGINLFGTGAAEGCTARECDTGIIASSSGRVTGCTASSCDIGIDAGSFSSVERCNVYSCTVAGIRVTQKGSISNCHVTQCPIGIHSSDPFGGSSVIARNAITQCTTGIRLASASNAVTGNVIAGSTTAIDAAAGNKVGSVQASPAAAGASDNIVP